MGIELLDRFPIKGHVKLSLFDDATKELIGVREADNLIVTSGLTLISQALNWLFIQNQNVSWGSPYAALSNLGDAWGAVGTSSATPLSTQTILSAEIGRAIVTAGAFSANTLSYDFFLGTGVGNGAIVEAGMFMQANQNITTLSSSLAITSVYTSLSVNALPAAIPINASIVIGYGTTQVQTVTTSAAAAPGATTISVYSFTANANYSTSANVAYLTGTMLDRTTFPAITKTSAMTGVLEITLTLVSG